MAQTVKVLEVVHVDPLLVEILEFRRPAGSSTEEAFIREVIDVIPNMNKDEFGNRFVVVGKRPPTTMFSCHTDTVHMTGGMQSVVIDPIAGHLFNPNKDVLGADDGAGIWLMLKMIDSGVDGLYVFHREEECGGGGSTYFAKHHTKLLESVQRCIAFDRKGQTSVVTHQYSGRSCSDTFAFALADELGASIDTGFSPDPTGTFTDSANYVHIIPECTNVSVGYENAHTAREYLDFIYLEQLLTAVLNVNWSELPTERTPSLFTWDDSDIDDAWDWGDEDPLDLCDEISWEDVYHTVSEDPVWAADYIYSMMLKESKR